MKIQHLIPILFLAAFCTVSAQTNNAITNNNSPALLTSNQVATLAMQLANVILANAPQEPFSTEQEYIAGHWVWFGCYGIGRPSSWLEVTVELAADGSTNSIKSVISSGGRAVGGAQTNSSAAPPKYYIGFTYDGPVSPTLLNKTNIVLETNAISK